MTLRISSLSRAFLILELIKFSFSPWLAYRLWLLMNQCAGSRLHNDTPQKPELSPRTMPRTMHTYVDKAATVVRC